MPPGSVGFLSALDITARAKALYGTEVKYGYHPEIFLKDLVATYGDSDTAFWMPDTHCLVSWE